MRCRDYENRPECCRKFPAGPDVLASPRFVGCTYRYETRGCSVEKLALNVKLDYLLSNGQKGTHELAVAVDKDSSADDVVAAAKSAVQTKGTPAPGVEYKDLEYTSIEKAGVIWCA